MPAELRGCRPLLARPARHSEKERACPAAQAAPSRRVSSISPASSIPSPVHLISPRIPAPRASISPLPAAAARSALTVPRGADGSALTFAPGEGAGGRRRLRPPRQVPRRAARPRHRPAPRKPPQAQRLQHGAPRKAPPSRHSLAAASASPHHQRQLRLSSRPGADLRELRSLQSPAALPWSQKKSSRTFPLIRSCCGCFRLPADVLPGERVPRTTEKPRCCCGGFNSVCCHLLGSFHTGHLTSK